MLTKEQRDNHREELFRHLDGIVVAPIAYNLHKNGVTDYLLEHTKSSLEEITNNFKANEGYLNVALRVLASQGWINYKIDENEVYLETNENSKIAFDHFSIYEGVVELLEYSGKFHSRKFELEPFYKLEKLFNQFENNFGLNPDQLSGSISNQILKHIEGILVGPTIVRLGMGGMFHKYFMEASFTPDEYHQHPESFDKILTFLSNLGWFRKNNGHYTFTDKGLFFAKRASAYGVTVSYIPMFRKTEELLFGDPNILWNHNSTDEIHVDREMNVW